MTLPGLAGTIRNHFSGWFTNSTWGRVKTGGTESLCRFRQRPHIVYISHVYAARAARSGISSADADGIIAKYSCAASRVTLSARLL